MRCIALDKDYREKIEEIAELAKTEDREAALLELDGMNWRKIHNVNILLKASKVYEEADRFDDARDLLEMAHERSPIGRLVIFQLALLCIKMGDLESAKAYYDDYVSIAPNEYRKYIIKYRLSQARGADEYTLIAVLEELKNTEFIEEWAYELACLYHKTQQVEKCVDLCDELALYYGDGPYVEKALELKMLYQPLSKEQEEQYRALQKNENYIYSGNTAVKQVQPNTIPTVELPPERFDTVNLQAEIKKNIDEIMNATETGAVSENMEIIKELAGEIPYLTIPEEKEEPEAKETEPAEDSLMQSYQKYLSEEYDGQISMNLPEEGQPEDVQIDGQMTIQDVIENWEKTRRAAEAALNDAEQEKLETEKAKALKEATHIMNRLENVIPKLDAGVQPKELLKEEYLSKNPQTDVSEAAKKDGEGFGLGLHTPVISPNEAGHEEGIGKILGSVPKGLLDEEEEKLADDWLPPHLESEVAENTEFENEDEDVNLQDASRIMEGVNDMLQREIDRLTGDSDLKMDLDEVEIPRAPEAEELDEVVESEDEEVDETPDDQQVLADTIVALMNEEEETAEPVEEFEEEYQEPEAAEEIEELETEEEEIENQIAEDEETLENVGGMAEEGPDSDINIDLGEIKTKEEEPELGLTQSISAALQSAATQIEETKVDDSVEETDKNESELNDKVVLTEEEQDLFTYFTPIEGLEDAICNSIRGAGQRLLSREPISTGNIAIIGGNGSGKTTLAKGLIRVLQGRFNKPKNNVGRIDGDKLNDKDIQALYDRVRGGCLVIEKAGELSLETAVSLSLIMDNDQERTLVIIEDNRKGIDRALSLNGQFAKKFTEKITIPVFTVEELVNFGKTYAADNGYVIDEMGVLAMYDRINSIQRLDRPTYLTDVKEIMDEAIEKASKKSFFHRRRSNEEGLSVLIEKDFL